MAEMVKKATRESFGEALVQLAQENPDVVVLDADWLRPPRPVPLKRHIPTALSTAALPSAT